MYASSTQKKVIIDVMEVLTNFMGYSFLNIYIY